MNLASRLLGRYRILGPLGRGGMAEVYRAYQPSLDREVAIKVLDTRLSSDPHFVARFQREAALVARLRHPNIVQVYDLDVDADGRFIYMVMELVRGPTLRDEMDQRLARGQPFTMREIAGMCFDMADALDHAHEQGMVHRDVKPGNIMFTEDHRLILADFGLARVLEDERKTLAGQMVGTPAYMSPEQCRGIASDAASDVYSLGVVLYEAIAGRLPFIATEGMIALAMKHVTDEPPRLRDIRADVPSMVERVVLQAMRKEPGERHASAGELAAALGQAVGMTRASRPQVVAVAVASASLADELADPTLRDVEQGSSSAGEEASIADWQLAYGHTPSEPLASREPPSFLAHAAPEDDAASGVFTACEHELESLLATVRDAASGQGRVAFVSGETGRGKSTMLQELSRRALHELPGLVVAHGTCDAYTGAADPYLPFRQVLAMLCGDIEAQCLAGALSSEHARRMWSAVPATVRALLAHGPELIPTFVPGELVERRIQEFPVHAVEWRARLAELDLDAQQMIPDRAQSFQRYADVLLALSADYPALIVLDDLHWVDSSSASLLLFLASRIRAARICIVGAYRPEDLHVAGSAGERHPLIPVLSELKSSLGDVGVDLDESQPAAQRAFVDALIDAEPNRLGPLFRERMTRHTGGQPLFTVELLREMRERGDLGRDEAGCWVVSDTLSWDTLPARVEGVIERRFGRLDPELAETLTVASVEGEEFTAEVIARVRGMDVRRVLKQLDRELNHGHRLVRERSLIRLGSNRRSLYVFRHNLFQKYLYNALGESERALLHEDVGMALEELYAHDTAEIAVQLARHYREAGDMAKAIDNLRVAGERAVRGYANHEASGLLAEALALLPNLPPSPERDTTELGLVSLLAPIYLTQRGYAAPLVRDTFVRARALCHQLDDREQLLQALKGMWVMYFVRGELDQAFALARELFESSAQRGDPAVMIEAHYALAGSFCEQGEFQLSHQHFVDALAHYDPSQHAKQVRFFGPDLGVFCHVWMSHPLWALGHEARAMEASERGLEMARQLSHPFSLAVAFSYAAMFHQLRRDVRAVERLAEQALEVSGEYGFPYYLAWSDILHAWARSHLGGDPSVEIVRIRCGLDALNATGGRVREPYYLGLLADVLARMGETDEALEILARAQRVAAENADHWWDAEILRLEAQLLVDTTDADPTSPDQERRATAEQRYRESIEIARIQNALSLELRTSVGLGRLLAESGRHDEARDLVRAIDARFDPDHTSVDRDEARALLATLPSD